MSDEDSQIADVREVAPDKRYGEALYYDLGKYLTTVSLLALGGVLSLMQTDAFEGVDRSGIVTVVALIVLGGAFALYASSGIAKARYLGREPGRAVRWHIRIAEVGISLGLGAFLALFLDLL